jgi:hypothetical protein
VGRLYRKVARIVAIQSSRRGSGDRSCGKPVGIESFK